MGRVGEDDTEIKKEKVEFQSIYFMRLHLGMPQLESGWVECICGCGDEFFTFDKRGNRVYEACKLKPRYNAYNDFEDDYTINGSLS
jgi:hypothetical protein